ncbi:MAG: acyl carrier protein [Rickettsiales bacterium TMED289]|nr:MAG: acyl carrier protein [Rickettsiales bacterium TMED289]|tara:strand:+ start:2509 stop:2736 length:228 start_codon:yes stop_codon:yes gene_type:complete
MIANKDIFMAIFDISSEKLDNLDLETSLDEDFGWDSMCKVMLISEVSETLDKVVEADDLEPLETVEELDTFISSL